MADVSITDIEIELNLLRSRIDAIRGEVTTFLEEVGAPTLVEARDRFRRFANAAIELPRRIETLHEVVDQANKSREDAMNRLQLQVNMSKELRTKVKDSKASTIQANARLIAAKAAMEDAVTLLESPMYSAMINDSRSVLRSLGAALKPIPADLPVTEE